jgi:hypothetical protein
LVELDPLASDIGCCYTGQEEDNEIIIIIHQKKEDEPNERSFSGRAGSMSTVAMGMEQW